MDHDETARTAASIVARAMTDADFKARLIADAPGVLRAEGVEVPDGLAITVVESSPSTAYIVLPDPEAFSDEFLAAASGGATASSAGTAGTFFCSSAPGTAGTIGSAGSVG